MPENPILRHGSNIWNRVNNILRDNMCTNCGLPPRNVEGFIQWYKQIHPNSNMDFSQLQNNHLQGRLNNCYLPLRCNICDYSYSESNQFRGQRYHNVWYGHSPCGGCSGGVSRPPEYWQNQAIVIYREDGIGDDLSNFLPSAPRVRMNITCSTCYRQYQKSLKDIRRLPGCSHCNDERVAISRRQSREQFIRRSQRNHSWRIRENDGFYPFDYSRIPETLTNNTEVQIGCFPCRDRGIENWFYPQTAANHSSGYGCRTCGGVESWSAERLRTFMQESRRHDGIRVEWNQVPNEINSRSSIPLICIAREHPTSKPLGTLVNHETGGNCRICSYIMRGRRRRTTRERFLNRASNRQVALADGGYRYDRVPNIMTMSSVIQICCIRCEESGSVDPYFPQRVSDHLSGCGCPTCNTGSFIMELPAVVYVLRIFINGEFTYWKVGKTNHTADERAADIYQSMRRNGLDGRVEIVDSWQYNTGRIASDIEDAILDIREDEFSCEGTYTPQEGRRFEGWTELFPSNFDLLTAVQSIISN